MSSADSAGGAAAAGATRFGSHRPSRGAYVVAALMPVLLLAGLAVPVGLVWAWSRVSAGQTSSGSVNRDGSATAGGAGVNDPYFPDHGSSGYDALGYRIVASWDADAEAFTSTTTITARATQHLDSFFYDLALTTDEVRVNGVPARFAQSGFRDVQVTPAVPIRAGATFTAEVRYSGQPGDLVRDGVTSAWRETGQEWTVAGEPESSIFWFPANDHPSDPATMDVSVRVPAGMEAISVGRLASRDTGSEADFDTWHWVSDAPMATYLNFVSIGQYAIEEGSTDGRPYVYAVSERLADGPRSQAFAALRQSPAIVRELEKRFGPYPFGEVGGLVPSHDLPFGGLETQTRPVYDQAAIRGDGATALIVHELAHMWFGDQVTVSQWNDIFLNEAYASFAQLVYDEQAGGRSANDRLNSAYERTRGRPEFWRITMIDPGADHLFDTVYTRGPMTLQALRNVMGDAAFFRFSREWAQQPGSRSVEEWMVRAQAATTIDLAPFFRAWILGDEAPAQTRANGFR